MKSFSFDIQTRLILIDLVRNETETKMESEKMMMYKKNEEKEETICCANAFIPTIGHPVANLRDLTAKHEFPK